MSEAASTSSIVLFESADGEVRLDVAVDAGKDEIWLNRSQMSLLFDRDVKTIGKHIANALKEELEDSPKPTVAKFATVQKEGDREVERQVEYYNLDVIISVGYRVKSQRGVEFRRWATDVLRRYIVEGRAENEKRLAQLAQVISVMERLPQEIGAAQILEIVKSYAPALDLLDDYDHQRIAASLFLYFLDRNGLLYEDGRKLIGDDALVATTIMIAESRPDEKEAMVSLVMNFLALGAQ